MARILFELDGTSALRDNLSALGVQYVDHGDRILVSMPDVPQEQCQFLLIQGITSHGMTTSSKVWTPTVDYQQDGAGPGIAKKQTRAPTREYAVT